MPADPSDLKRNEAARWIRHTLGVVGGRDLPADPSEDDLIEFIQSDLSEIPQSNFLTLKRLFGFLRKLSGNAGNEFFSFLLIETEVTKMTGDNIAIVLKPTLHLSSEVIIAMMAHFDQIFNEKKPTDIPQPESVT